MNDMVCSINQRKSKVLQNDEWIEIDGMDIKKGMIFKLFEPDGTPVIIGNYDIFVAISDSYKNKEDVIVTPADVYDEKLMKSSEWLIKNPCISQKNEMLNIDIIKPPQFIGADFTIDLCSDLPITTKFSESGCFIGIDLITRPDFVDKRASMSCIDEFHNIKKED